MTTNVKWSFCWLVWAARIERARDVVPEQAASYQSPNLACLLVPPCPHRLRWRMDGLQGRPLANEFLLQQVLLFALLSFWENFKEVFPAPLRDVALAPQSHEHGIQMRPVNYLCFDFSPDFTRPHSSGMPSQYFLDYLCPIDVSRPDNLRLWRALRGRVAVTAEMPVRSCSLRFSKVTMSCPP